MPLMKCEVDGRQGWKFGASGKCYVYTTGDDASEKAARAKAMKQAAAWEMKKGGAWTSEDLDSFLLFADAPQADKGPTTRGIKFVIGFLKGGGSEVQSVVFEAKTWTLEQAKAWLEKWNMKSGSVEKTEDSYRFRQSDPGKYERFRYIAPTNVHHVAPAEGLSELYRLAESAKAGERIPMMLFPIGIWKSKRYPKLSLTREVAEAMIANFEANVLGTEPVVDSSGKHDTAAEAAGWIKDLRIAPTKDGGEALYADWEPTDLGAAQLNEKRYQYNSVEIGEVIDNVTGVKTTNVLRSVTLTNTPILRMLPPVLEAGEAIAASEPIEVALSELEPVDPVTGLIDDIDTLLAKLDDNLKGKAGIRAMRTYLRETKTKVAAHTLAEDPSEFTPSEPSPSGGATGEALADGTCAAGVGVRLNLSKERSMSDLTELLKLSESDDDALILAEVKKVITENATFKAKFAEGEKAERVRKLDAAITETHVLPAEKDVMLALAESAPVTFDATLKAREDAGVKLVDTSERGNGTPPPEPKEYADPSIELAEKAQAKAKADGIEYGEAMHLVITDDPALAERYVTIGKEV